VTKTGLRGGTRRHLLDLGQSSDAPERNARWGKITRKGARPIFRISSNLPGARGTRGEISVAPCSASGSSPVIGPGRCASHCSRRGIRGGTARDLQSSARRHIMLDEQDGATARMRSSDLDEGTSLKDDVATASTLVDDQDLGIEGARDRERERNIHTAE